MAQTLFHKGHQFPQGVTSVTQQIENTGAWDTHIYIYMSELLMKPLMNKGPLH